VQSANFRDEVVFALANKMGLDPTVDLSTDLAQAYVSFINAWVRRLYPNFDWPEWTLTEQRTPDLSHYVAFAQPDKAVIGRVLKVYLADPATVNAVLDIPFKLHARGVHCGFEHGSSVWIKFIQAAPQYTASPWNAATNYRKGELTYLPAAGECFKSRVNNNVGHNPADPSFSGHPPPAEPTPSPLATEITQEAIGDDPGVAAKNKQMTVDLAVLGGTVTIPDPPPIGTSFNIKVTPAGGSSVAKTRNGDGSSSLEDLATGLAGDLSADPGLAAFTITSFGTTITFEAANDFELFASYGPGGGVSYPMVTTQQQAYTAAVAASPGQPQVTKVSVSDDQVNRDTEFTVTLIDALGTEHPFSYTANVNDSALQVLNGIAASLASAGATDPVLATVSASIDTALNTIAFSSPKAAAVDASFLPVASAYWEWVPFPLELVDPVVRGAYSDALREDGQHDKAQAEEQAAMAEVNFKRNAILAAPYDLMTDQARAAARYDTPPLIGKGA